MNKNYLNAEFFAKLDNLLLNLRTSLSGYIGGQHQIKKYGQSIEFADYKNYELGDDIRKIDWNLYARLGKYFLKLNTDERQMHVQIFLDCSSSMGLLATKKDYALSISLALGYLALNNGDKVTFYLLKGDKAESLGSTITDKDAFFNIFNDLSKITFEKEVNLAKAISSIENSNYNDGLSIIISDFFQESGYIEAINFLQYQKKQILLLQILDEEEINPSFSGKYHLLDSESLSIGDEKNVKIKITHEMLNEYHKILKEEIENMKKNCLSRKVSFISISTSDKIEKVLFQELEKLKEN